MRHDPKPGILVHADAPSPGMPGPGFATLLAAHGSYLHDMLASLGYRIADLAASEQQERLRETCASCESRKACRDWLDSRVVEPLRPGRIAGMTPGAGDGMGPRDAIPGFCPNRPILSGLLAHPPARKSD